MPGDISIDVGSAIPYAIERLLGLFGKDLNSIKQKEELKKHLEQSVNEASYVQCFGMSKPIHLKDIYIPTNLLKPFDQSTNKSIISDDLIKEEGTSIVTAGPGRGKTILLHWMYLNLFSNQDFLPILFTLRWPNMVQQLKTIVENLDGKKPKQKVVLLIDGYDEIGTYDRQIVSASIREFTSLKIGTVILTCRSHYDIIDLVGTKYFIEDLSIDEAVIFASRFFEMFEVNEDPSKFVEECVNLGFDDYLKHPLLLTLVCFLRSGSLTNIPKYTIGLIRRALDILTYRWDAQRGIERESHEPLDGEDRIRCLMQIAYDSTNLSMSELNVTSSIRKFLTHHQYSSVNISNLMLEMARWYGILVPVRNGEWTFVHKTIHDFLAARFWVESGEFANSAFKENNSRAAYAACLVPDASHYLRRILYRSGDLNVFVECLRNNAKFSPKSIASSLVKHYKKFRTVGVQTEDDLVTIKTETDTSKYSSEKLLLEMLKIGSKKDTYENFVVFTLALIELIKRKADLEVELPDELTECTIEVLIETNHWFIKTPITSKCNIKNLDLLKASN